MRRNSESWSCIICGHETYSGLLCLSCDEVEKNKQRAMPGSLTQKQFNYIEHLISGLTTDETSKVIYETLPEFDGDFSNLAQFQAGALISELLALVNSKKETATNERD